VIRVEHFSISDNDGGVQQRHSDCGDDGDGEEEGEEEGEDNDDDDDDVVVVVVVDDGDNSDAVVVVVVANVDVAVVMDEVAAVLFNGEQVV
jgi:hypothetical protein